MHKPIELQPDQTILFIGDSITDAGHTQPYYRPFGFGYVHFVANTLLAKYQHLDISIKNEGISGNTVQDLQRRWQTDCLEHSPDILSVMIGVNDLWQRHTGLNDSGTDEYELTFKRLLSQAKERCNCRFILLEPFMFCRNSQNEMRRSLTAYIDVVHRLAEQFDALLVPLQKHFDEQIPPVPQEKWSEDFVHPHVWAHAWIAMRWLDVTSL
jgi:lysophospholipase L1-like esterase